jgi:hypothetical protein
MKINTDRLLTTGQAAEYLNVSVYWLEKARCRGYGPNYIRITARAIRYRISDLEAFLMQGVVETLSRGKAA